MIFLPVRSTRSRERTFEINGLEAGRPVFDGGAIRLRRLLLRPSNIASRGEDDAASPGSVRTLLSLDGNLILLPAIGKWSVECRHHRPHACCGVHIACPRSTRE